MRTWVIRETWKIINNLMGRNKRSNTSVLNINNENVSDRLKIAEGFNSYFSNVSENLARSIENTNISFEQFLPHPTPFSFYFRPTTLREIKDV